MYCKSCGVKIEVDEMFCKNCGNKTDYQDKDNLGIFNINRKKSFVGCVINFDVYVDETKVGTLKNGGNINCNIPLGEHEVKISNPTGNVITQNIILTKDKRTVKINVKVKMGLLAGKANIIDLNYE